MQNSLFFAIDTQINELDNDSRKKFLENRIKNYRIFRASLRISDPYKLISEIDPVNFFTISMELSDKDFDYSKCLMDMTIIINDIVSVIKQQGQNMSGDFSGLFRHILILNQNNLSSALSIFDKNSPYFKKPSRYIDNLDLSNSRKIPLTEIIDAVLSISRYGKKYFDSDYAKMKAAFSLMKNAEYLDKFTLFLQIINDKLMLKCDLPKEFVIVKYVDNVLRPLGDKIDKDIKKKEKELQKLSKKNKEKKEAFLSLKEKIYNNRSDELLTAEDIQSTLIDDDVVETAFYMYTLLHNDNIYQDVLDKKKHNLGYLCVLYDLDFSSLTDEEIQRLKSIDYIRVEKFFEFVSGTNIFKLIKTNPKIVDIIEYSSTESINNIWDAIKNDILDSSIIDSLTEVLFDSNTEKLNKNISLLRTDRLDVSLASKVKPNILLQDTTDTSLNIRLLDRYIPTESRRTLDNFNMVEDSRYFDMMDILIENGLYGNMLEDFSLISSESKNIALKVLLSRAIGYEYENTKGKIKNTITAPNNFMVPDSDLEEYVLTYDSSHLNPKYLKTINDSKNNVISEEVVKLPIVRSLNENCRNDELTYNIGGSTISKNKVLRYLTTLEVDKANDNEVCDMVFNAVIINSLIDNDCITRIQDTINTLSGNYGPKKAKILK